MSGDSVTFPSENPLGDVPGVVIGKESKGLIVLHEWWGKTQQIVKQGAEMASQGNLTVLVPDLYW